MSDDTKAAEAAKAEAEAKSKKADELMAQFKELGIKVYDEGVFGEVVKQRDEAKKKVRETEDFQKKMAEAKLLEDGKLTELLNQRTAELEQAKQRETALSEKAKLFEEQQVRLRDATLAKIADPKARAIAEKLPSVADIVEYTDLITTTRAGVDNTKGKQGGRDGVDPRKRRPEENEQQWVGRLRNEGLLSKEK